MHLILGRVEFEFLFIAIGVIGVCGLIYLSYDEKKDNEPTKELTPDQLIEIQRQIRAKTKQKLDVLKQPAPLKQDSPTNQKKT